MPEDWGKLRKRKTARHLKPSTSNMVMAIRLEYFAELTCDHEAPDYPP